MLKKIAYSIILCVLCVIAYANSWSNAFVYDDYPVLLENPLIGKPANFILKPTMLLYSLNYVLNQDRPFTYHLTNTLLHIAVTILVFFMLQRFFSAAASAIGAGVFAVHPVHTEAVTWITGSSYVMIAFFVLIVYLLYQRATAGMLQSKKYYWASLAVFSYMVLDNYTFFALTIFLLIWSDITFGVYKKTWKLWLPFFGILAVRALFLGGALASRIASTAEETGIAGPIWENPVPRFLHSFIVHAALLFWPAELTLYHEPLKGASAWLVAGGLAVLGLIVLSPVIFKRAKPLFLGLGIFIIFLIPTYSPLVVASTLGERYIYFPSVVLSMAAAFIWAKSEKRDSALQASVLLFFIIVAGALTWRTIVRNADWRTQNTIWRSTLETAPNSPWAHNNMGFVFQQEGKFAEAIIEYKRAIELKPNLFSSYNNLGAVYYSMGDREEAAQVYAQLLTINPRYIKAYNNLGSIYSSLGKKDEAIEVYKKALQIDPNYGIGYYNLGLMYQEMGKTEEAQALLAKAMSLRPDLSKRNIPADMQKIDLTKSAKTALPDMNTAEGHNQLGVQLSTVGRHEEAVSEYRKAIAMAAEYVDAYSNLGNAYMAVGNKEEAIASYIKAIELNPKHAVAYFNLSVAHSEKGEYAKAIEYCDKAQGLGYQPPQDYMELLKSYRKQKR